MYKKELKGYFILVFMKTGVYIYYCDNCNSEFPSITHLNRHNKTAKHIKLDGQSKPIKCIHCNGDFTEEGYKIHSERNKLYWKHKNDDNYKFVTDECSCNNFLFFNKRYSKYKHIIPEANSYISRWREKCDTYSDYSSATSSDNSSEEETEQNICITITD